MSGDQKPAWWIYEGTGLPRAERDLSAVLPAPPGWRSFDGGPALPAPAEHDGEFHRRLGVASRVSGIKATQDELNMVNAAIYLRRPLLVTGRPGTGKSSLAYKIARELRLGPVLRWPITSRSAARDGLWEYDAIGRVQAAAGGSGEAGIGDFVQLGPLGTALLPYEQPRVLLIDELDKSDIDLPNDLLNIFEDGEYDVPPLVRVAATEPEVSVFTADRGERATVREGRVRCRAFPIIVVTSNGEREFPPAFLRRCLRLDMHAPGIEQLVTMVSAHFPGTEVQHGTELVRAFVDRSAREGGLAADQLLNAVFLATSGAFQQDEKWDLLRDALWQRLGAAETD
ncbi:AAA domain (dynein-related subfamily) [Amycolatopsis xylanica]|uniref:AAA domain (Dynein-related subfamily) n=1 Tax=Amycolatopsis xylanica TaxID=589385 RepID=A0A1H3JQG5_9PSEU|nr:MoxR family ATPase [Amycolatopsis xylanica]SDY41524.1 AAA domain (dynein-related subfamily) [Amycolatopsis xylanica]